MLKNRTIKLNQTDRYGNNAFWMAAFYGNVEVMKYLAEHGANVHAKNHNGSNVLHIAVKKNNLKVV
jgi:ankyrin repeat protein